MTDKDEKRYCPHCNGEGVIKLNPNKLNEIPPTPLICTNCNGVGYFKYEMDETTKEQLLRVGGTPTVIPNVRGCFEDKPDKDED